MLEGVGRGGGEGAGGVGGEKGGGTVISQGSRIDQLNLKKKKDCELRIFSKMNKIYKEINGNTHSHILLYDADIILYKIFLLVWWASSFSSQMYKLFII